MLLLSLHLPLLQTNLPETLLFFPANLLLKKLVNHGLPLKKLFMLLNLLMEISITVEEEKDGLF
jgi:hypothetical protein